MTPFSHQPRLRQLQAPAFNAGQLSTVSVKTGSQVREFQLRNKGTLTCPAATNIAANTKRGDEWSFWKMVTVTVNNDTVIFKRTGNEWFWENYFMNGEFPQITPALADGATLNPTFDSTMPIQFWDPRTYRPWDTVLETGKFANLDLSVDFGLFSDFNSVGGTALACTPELYVDEALGGPDNPDPRSGLAHDLPWRNRKVTIFSGTGVQQVPLEVGNRIYERILINTQTAGGVDSNTILNSMTLKSGPVTFFKQGFIPQQQIIRQKWHLPSAYDFSAAAYNTVTRSNTGTPAGWVMIDLIRGGDFRDGGLYTEGVDARSLGELVLELDVAVAGTVVVLPIGRIPT